MPEDHDQPDEPDEKVLVDFGIHPVLTTCPHCGRNIKTKVTTDVGLLAWVISIGMCFLGFGHKQEFIVIIFIFTDDVFTECSSSFVCSFVASLISWNHSKSENIDVQIVNFSSENISENFLVFYEKFLNYSSLE